MSYGIALDEIREKSFCFSHIRHKSETPNESWQATFSVSHLRTFDRCAVDVRLDYSSPAFCQSQMAKSKPRRTRDFAALVDRQTVTDTTKLSSQVVFKETDENWTRLEELSERTGRPMAFVARALFRVGLESVEGAIIGGLLR